MSRAASKPEPKSKAFAVICAILYGLFLLAVLAFSTLVGWLYSSKTIRELGAMAVLHPKSIAEVFPGQQSMTVLILGCDENRTIGGAKITNQLARSDTMLVAKFDFTNNRVYGLNIPRDTLCALPGYRAQKINAYHAIGGNAMAAAAVEHMLPGVKIDRTVSIDYAGFRQMIDALGGVYLDVPKNMNYDDNAGHLHIHLKKGPQWLDGQTAEDFARFRHSDSDLVREDRQHMLIRAFAERLKEKPTALTGVLDAAVSMLSDGFNAEEVLSIGDWLKSIPSSSMSFGIVPTENGPHSSLVAIKSQIPVAIAKYHLASGDNSAPSEPESAGSSQTGAVRR